MLAMSFSGKTCGNEAQTFGFFSSADGAAENFAMGYAELFSGVKLTVFVAQVHDAPNLELFHIIRVVIFLEAMYSDLVCENE